MKLTIFLLLLAAFTAEPSEGRRAEEDGEPSIGIALNGGSNTAANGCASVLRGFQQQQIKRDGKDRPAMEAFDLVSGLSGGNMPNIQYHYATYTDSNTILDASGINDPTDITLAELDSIPMKSMFKSYVNHWFPSVLLAIIHATLFGGPIWPEAVYNQLLAPYGIDRNSLMSDMKIRDDVTSTPVVATSMVGPTEICPAWTTNRMNRGVFDEYNANFESLSEGIGDEDPEFNDLLDEVYAVLGMTGYPAQRLIDNGDMLELVKKHTYQIPLPAFGTHENFHVPLSSAGTIVFDEAANITANPLKFRPVVASYEELSESETFTLKKLLGMGTDTIILGNMVETIEKITEFVPISVNIPTANNKKREMAFSDGGYNEGTGIPALVHLKTKSIISVQCPSPSALGMVFDEHAFLRVLATTYGPFFGVAFPLADPKSFTAAYPLQHMFDLNSNGVNQMVKLANTMKSLHAAGEPMITTLSGLNVVDNPFWGITGGWKLDLTIILLVGVPKRFADKIPKGIVSDVAGEDIYVDGFFINTSEFHSVPNVIPIEAGMDNYTFPGTDVSISIPVIGEALPIRAARMTQIMVSWCIKRAWDGLVVDGDIKFAGFRKLFKETPVNKRTKVGKSNKSPKGLRSSKTVKSPKVLKSGKAI